MKIVKLAPGLDPGNHLARVLGSGFEVREFDPLRPLVEQVRDAEVLLLRDVPVPASLIDAETRASRIDSDVSPGSADTLALRAFRATLIACDTTADETVLRTAGIRLPDPAKDSLLIEQEGQWFAAAFAIAAPPATHACIPAPGETVTAMRITPRKRSSRRRLWPCAWRAASPEIRPSFHLPKAYWHDRDHRLWSRKSSFDSPRTGNQWRGDRHHQRSRGRACG